jgi:hypothetical protein
VVTEEQVDDALGMWTTAVDAASSVQA